MILDCLGDLYMSGKRETEEDLPIVEEKKAMLTLETEIGVLKPQAKECWESPETGRGKEWSHPQGDFSSVILISCFWSLELSKSSFLLF